MAVPLHPDLAHDRSTLTLKAASERPPRSISGAQFGLRERNRE
jgi:hypothetical protein